MRPRLAAKHTAPTPAPRVAHARPAACALLQVGALGSGAFSTVVRARDRETGEEVAVKLIKRGSLVRRGALGLWGMAEGVCVGAGQHVQQPCRQPHSKRLRRITARAANRWC